jgi:type I restriction enzyme S subunit
MVNMGELFAFSRIKNISMDRVPLDSKERETSLLQAGDLLFARQSLVLSGAGKCSIFISDDEDVCFESHIIRCRLSSKLADPNFYYYFFQSPKGRSLVQSIVEQGAGASGIRGSDLAGIEVPWIGLGDQLEIARVLVSIDELIAVNDAICKSLESIVQVIFKSWFVDFDPVKDKIAALQEGRDPLRAAMSAISGKSDAEIDALSPQDLHRLQSIAVLFPDQWSEADEDAIPFGWVRKPLAAMIRIVGGGTPKRSVSDYWGGNIPWYSVKDAPSESDVFVVDTEEHITPKGLEESATRLLPVGTTIISARGTVGKLALTAVPMAMNQSCYGVQGVEGIGAFFNYYTLKEAVATLQRNTHGAVFDTITQATFETVTSILPSEHCLAAFEEMVAPLMQQILQSVRQNNTLRALRDALLPRLLSGEITVNADGHSV